ncbi:MAG: helix-turn-helix domain-containing protein [candidate division KSB1 bacterium]|nr:helix-turn-helix domain-containing protein [candidate division KSB1 bacterium]MDZ7317873.1 helix-turn-helix domain-containing protein [candidate division KSB1 bacterium]MDZ7341404.1 helix-turn-helix domain-containing protein [candidate division KSB1 bacterium]
MKEQALAQFGLKLQEARTKKKLELEQVANQTKVNINFLKKMEAGQFDFLPDLYVRNFLKLYLRCIGQDPAEFLHEYDQLQRKEDEPPPVITVTDEDLKAFTPTKGFAGQFADLLNKIKPYLKQLRLLGVIGGAAIILILLYVLLRKPEPPPAVEVAPIATVVPDSPKVAIDSLPKPVAVTPPPKFDRLNLELKGLQRTWLQIAVDDSAAQEHIFDAGMSHRWSGKDRFKLLIGNGAGVRLYLNGKDLGPLGQTGQVVRFQVTENGIEKDRF